MLGFIVWGSTNKEQVLERGRFFCPSCASTQPYHLVRIRRFFTLYFVPLFPTSTLAEYAACRGCERSFDPQILDASEEELRQAAAPWQCACGNANPTTAAACLACNEPRHPEGRAPQTAPTAAPRRSARRRRR